jgi:hypothetical protein
MNRRHWPAPLILAVSILVAGCGSGAPTPSTPAFGTPPSLATAAGTTAGTWAVAVMGGAAAQHNNFWQLFARPADSATWRLVTPPGVASNGGLVIAPAGGRSLTAGFRPTQGLVFTPLALTGDGGSTWSAGVLDAALANVPDALAAAPATGRLLALLTDGTAEVSGPGATWTRLVTQSSLAASAATARCGLQQLTAAAFTSAGVALLAGACAHPGFAGIFSDTGGGWHPTGPAMPAALARQPVTVLRLTTTPGGVVALLQAGTGPAASLLAAWSADGGGHWELSPPYRLGGAGVSAASFGPSGAVSIVLSGNRGVTIAGAAGPWQALPSLPPGTATLAAGRGSALDALAVRSATLTVWQTVPGGTAWTQIQTMKVDIRFGSSA